MPKKPDEEQEEAKYKFNLENINKLNQKIVKKNIDIELPTSHELPDLRLYYFSYGQYEFPIVRTIDDIDVYANREDEPLNEFRLGMTNRFIFHENYRWTSQELPKCSILRPNENNTIIENMNGYLNDLYFQDLPVRQRSELSYLLTFKIEFWKEVHVPTDHESYVTKSNVIHFGAINDHPKYKSYSTLNDFIVDAQHGNFPDPESHDFVKSNEQLVCEKIHNPDSWTTIQDKHTEFMNSFKVDFSRRTVKKPSSWQPWAWGDFLDLTVQFEGSTKYYLYNEQHTDLDFYMVLQPGHGKFIDRDKKYGIDPSILGAVPESYCLPFELNESGSVIKMHVPVREKFYILNTTPKKRYLTVENLPSFNQLWNLCESGQKRIIGGYSANNTYSHVRCDDLGLDSHVYNSPFLSCDETAFQDMEIHELESCPEEQ